tara:strand:+ start:220 stop:771 length:552 start_codon:yes stop_codon:yes gene_type:complete
MKITKGKLKQIVIEELDKELTLLNEQSIINKIVYAPAKALMAIERAVRKSTGIRGVLDPSVIEDADGKLIIPPPSKLKQWQKDYPGWYSLAQTVSNQTLGDPVGLIASALGGGVIAKGAKGAKAVVKSLKAVKPAKLTKANLAIKAKKASAAAAKKLATQKKKAVEKAAELAFTDSDEKDDKA